MCMDELVVKLAGHVPITDDRLQESISHHDKRYCRMTLLKVEVLAQGLVRRTRAFSIAWIA